MLLWISVDILNNVSLSLYTNQELEVSSVTHRDSTFIVMLPLPHSLDLSPAPVCIPEHYHHSYHIALSY